MRISLLLLVASILLAGAGAQSLATTGKACFDQTPIPRDISVVPATENTPKDTTAFLGIWSNGKWGGVLCNTLIVTEIADDGRAKVIYSIGKYHSTSPEYWKRTAKIRGGVLRFRIKRAELEYRIGQDGALEGTYYSYGGKWTVALVKIEVR